MKTIQTDILIVGTGASGLFAALHVPEDRQVLMITKDEVEHSDSFSCTGRDLCVKRRYGLRQFHGRYTESRAL